MLIGALSLLVLLTVSQDSLAAGSDTSAYQTTGDAVLAARDWAHGFIGPLAFNTGAGLYYLVLHGARLIPRWLSGWGLVGVALGLLATVYAGLTQEFGFSTLNTVLNIPIALQEMVLAVWLIAKGFNRVALGTDGQRPSHTAPG